VSPKLHTHKIRDLKFSPLLHIYARNCQSAPLCTYREILTKTGTILSDIRGCLSAVWSIFHYISHSRYKPFRST